MKNLLQTDILSFSNRIERFKITLDLENRIAKFPFCCATQRRRGVWPRGSLKGKEGEEARISRCVWPTHRTPVVRGTACRDRPIARPYPIAGPFVFAATNLERVGGATLPENTGHNLRQRLIR